MSILASIVPLGLAAAASPVPLLVLLLLLLTPRAVANGMAFTAGWAVSLLAVGAGILVVRGPGDSRSDDAIAVAPLEAALGLVLLVLAGWQWRRRPRNGAAVPVPGWLTAADDCTPARAFALGTLLVVLNPKVLALAVVAAGTIGAASSEPALRGTGLLVFAGLGSLGAAIPLGLRVAMGARAGRRLLAWRDWLVAHGAAVTTAVLTTVGLLLLTRAAAAV